MERIINNYQDKLDAIEEKIDADIEEVMKQINISVLIDNPLKSMQEITEILKDKLDDYYPEAIKNGIKFSEKINAERKDKQ